MIKTNRALSGKGICIHPPKLCSMFINGQNDDGYERFTCSFCSRGQGDTVLCISFPDRVPDVYRTEASGSPKSFVARHAIGGTISHVHVPRKPSLGKALGMQSRFVWKFFDGKRARNRKAAAARPRHYLWKEEERSLWNGGGASGSTVPPSCHGRENIGGSALVRRAGFMLLRSS